MTTGLEGLLGDVIARAQQAHAATVDPDCERAEARRVELESRRENLDAFRACLPEEDIERIVAGDLDSRAWRIVARWLSLAEERGMRFLWLTGPAGTGKTVAMAGVLAQRGGMVMLGPDLVRAFRFDHAEARAIREKLLRHHTVILDDVGTRSREEEADALFTIVNGRQGAGKVTLISSNLTKAEVERYDTRIIDRVNARGAIVELAGNSMRAKGGPRG